MESDSPKICRLCLKIIFDNNLEVLDSDKKNMLEVLPVIMTTLNKGPMICRVCCKKLQQAFEFKSCCLSNDDYIKTFMNTDMIKGTLHLEAIIIANRNISIEGIKVEEENICRLCLRYYLIDSLISLCNLEEDIFLKEMMDKCLPEIDLSISHSPLMCNSCMESLQNQFNFLACCLDTNEIIKGYVSSKQLLPEELIDLNRVFEYRLNLKNQCENEYSLNYVKAEDYTGTDDGFFCDISDEKPYQYKKEDNQDKFVKMELTEHKPTSINPVLIEEQEQNIGEHNSTDRQQTKLFDCKICSYKTNHKCHMESHLRTHETKSLKCNTCKFQTDNKYYLKKHELRHKGLLVPKRPPETAVFKCALCSFESKHKGSLQRHVLLMHKPLPNAEPFKCEMCPFVTKYKGNLQKHILIHEPLAETPTFKCEFCAYKTIHKCRYQLHCLIHKPLSEVEIFNCELCSYKTNKKGNLQRHVLCHKPLSEVKVFKCEFCSYKTNKKGNLQRHVMTHDPDSDVKTYKCKLCTFDTKEKSTLLQHMLVHKPLSAVNIFKCEICTFVTKYKKNLRKHILKHKPKSESKVFKCKNCYFETKHKSNIRRHKRTHKSLPQVEVNKC